MLAICDILTRREQNLESTSILPKERREFHQRKKGTKSIKNSSAFSLVVVFVLSTELKKVG